MYRARKVAAACLLSLVAAAPCLAQAQDDDGEPRISSTLGPSYAEASGRRSEALAGNGTLFPGRARGVGVTSRPFVREDGTTAVRNGVVGSLPITDNVNVGVGLFAVNRNSPRERDFKRIQPMRDVNERGSRIAAVGLSVRF